ncbi:DUF6461 domain-containing protein [Actinomadura sp. DC4]|uniref:DUF6461 domain-containing protein n=1 Tax=Actinomadura sp. DC4 TaxID=3055069 RepID=UPI0025B25255|nr:DUF6461 domain-containing protein [Actinomadura sp. DC4]MDN3354445.1 DUF6461 domain-containing protein [Actinomadura sp. DC4]
MIILRSKLYSCVASDHYCVTCVRGLPPDEVPARLGVSGQGPHPQYTSLEAARHFGYGVPVVRVHAGGDWTLLLEVNPNITDAAFQKQLLSRLSVGTEAVCVQKLMDSTAKATHARDGEVLATYLDWDFTPAKGPDPSRLNRGLSEVGFFQDGSEDYDHWNPAEMVLLAVEREFEISVFPDIVNGPLPTVRIPGWNAPEPAPQSLQRKPDSTPRRPRRQSDRSN